MTTFDVEQGDVVSTNKDDFRILEIDEESVKYRVMRTKEVYEESVNDFATRLSQLDNIEVKDPTKLDHDI